MYFIFEGTGRNLSSWYVSMLQIRVVVYLVVLLMLSNLEAINYIDSCFFACLAMTHFLYSYMWCQINFSARATNSGPSAAVGN